MKKLYVMLSMMLALSTAANAVPVQRGIKKVLTLADGTKVMAEMRGDEYLSWWEADNGQTFVEEGDTYKAVDLAPRLLAAQELRARRNSERAARMARVKSAFNNGNGEMRALMGGEHVTYTGKKKGLIILVEFPDKKFKDNHDLEYYKNVANTPGFTNSEGYVGSVRDYFYDQSNGQFELDFDVLGPVEAAKSYTYYGGNSPRTDYHIGELIKEACDGVADQVNFSDYDWDGDGTADQVFVLYAGLGEAAGGDKNTIWPHESSMSYQGGALTYPTGKVNTYACSCELQRYLTADGYDTTDHAAGIGTICHEFSHCLGFPDFYDTNGQKLYGMGFWDLMATGSYLGNSFRPCNYTGFERIYAGWTEPIVLEDPATVESMKSASDNGRPFIIYNDGHTDEAYILENRQKTGWDKSLYGNGLIITHLDYNATYWAGNRVNYTGLDHQRCTIFHADRSDLQTTAEELQGDPYPFVKGGKVQNDELTDDSYPAATLYNRNSDRTYYMGKPLTAITRNADGTIAFQFMGGDADNILDNSATATAISSVNVGSKAQDNRIFSIDGRYLGTDIAKLGKGIYVVGGKKIVK